MLESLCGNKTVEKVLLFLFVNRKCYGTQLHRLLETPLTPLQKALVRLEKGGIIKSEYEGKVRVYQFHPNYPLLEELENLLKKTYTLLPLHEKKAYSIPKQKNSVIDSVQNKKKIVLDCWKRLTEIKNLRCDAKTKEDHQYGLGEVIVTKEKANVLLFHEKGYWNTKYGQKIEFSNTLRWTLNNSTNVISLEHLRRGLQHPVFLFHLVPTSNRLLTSLDPHICKDDTYFGQLQLNQNSLYLHWRFIGPHKNDEIIYHYS